MGLFDIFRPKWKHSSADVRVAAASETNDENILIEMAAKDREWFVRHHAFDVLRSRDCGQHVYAQLARTAGDEEIRRKAIKKLTDLAVLQEVATGDKYRYIRDAAEHRLEELRENIWGENQQAESAKTAG
ncbi:MAG: hypothetical protein WD733_08415 [Bryobacterales bacterium]